MGKEPRSKALSELMFTHKFMLTLAGNRSLHQTHYGLPRWCRKCVKEIHHHRVVYSYKAYETRLTPTGVKIAVPSAAALLGTLGVLGNRLLEYFNLI